MGGKKTEEPVAVPGESPLDNKTLGEVRENEQRRELLGANPALKAVVEWLANGAPKETEFVRQPSAEQFAEVVHLINGAVETGMKDETLRRVVLDDIYANERLHDGELPLPVGITQKLVRAVNGAALVCEHANLLKVVDLSRGKPPHDGEPLSTKDIELLAAHIRDGHWTHKPAYVKSIEELSRIMGAPSTNLAERFVSAGLTNEDAIEIRKAVDDGMEKIRNVKNLKSLPLPGFDAKTEHSVPRKKVR